VTRSEDRFRIVGKKGGGDSPKRGSDGGGPRARNVLENPVQLRHTGGKNCEKKKQTKRTAFMSLTVDQTRVTGSLKGEQELILARGSFLIKPQRAGHCWARARAALPKAIESQVQTHASRITREGQEPHGINITERSDKTRLGSWIIFGFVVKIEPHSKKGGRAESHAKQVVPRRCGNEKNSHSLPVP